MRLLQGGGTLANQPLPTHKFTPHDVVELRPSKGTSEGPALCSGVVYRVRDDVIVMALDDSPDADLDQPLRLHKLANEVGQAVHAPAGGAGMCIPGTTVMQSHSAASAQGVCLAHKLSSRARQCLLSTLPGPVC